MRPPLRYAGWQVKGGRLQQVTEQQPLLEPCPNTHAEVEELGYLNTTQQCAGQGHVNPDLSSN